MLDAMRRRGMGPGLAASAAVGLWLGGLLVGYEPVGGDPDRIFRPIKAELARALVAGRLPFWSDRLGLGVPLVAESHSAAFYPPNWLVYSILSVPIAYRLAMWGHYVSVAAATFAYARVLGVGAWGGAVSAVSFAFCGFLTVQSSHEWAYHTLAYLPLCLIAADRYAAKGGVGWLSALALLWGVQITLGHFQVQAWTGGLALLTGGWRVLADRRPVGRLLGLASGLAWGGAVAAVQLVPTWELAQLVGQTRRPYAELAFYSYPPAHWAELAVPGLFRGLRGGPESAYWWAQQTTGYEACLFIGTVPLILACVGLVGGGSGLSPWRLIVPASLALATMPRWWPQGYALALQVPGLGYFRCPARYTAVTSLGLALLAGRGLDRGIGVGRFRAGLGLAVAFGGASVAWALAWPSLCLAFRASIDDAGLAARLGLAAVSWALGLTSIVRWRWAGGAGWGPFALAAVEAGAFFTFAGTTRWGWSVSLPDASPVLTRLSADRGVGRVGGGLDNLPVRAGLATATPYTGFPLLPPHPLLKAAQDPRAGADPASARWLRRYGVTHLVRDLSTARGPGPVVFRGRDPALDVLAARAPGMPEGRLWRVVRLDAPFPEARVALRAVNAADHASLVNALSRREAADEAWFLPGEGPPSPAVWPRARSARVVRWDGLSGEVEHDGACDLVLTRAYYPGWVARVGDGPEIPAARADGGLLSVRIDGEGRHRVALRFRPRGLAASSAVSIASVTVAAAGLLAAGRRRRGQ